MKGREIMSQCVRKAARGIFIAAMVTGFVNISYSKVVDSTFEKSAGTVSLNTIERYEENSVRTAQMSINEADAANKAPEDARARQRSQCLENQAATERRENEEAEAAIAAANAGKQLDLTEKAAILRVQRRPSSFVTSSWCR